MFDCQPVILDLLARQGELWNTEIQELAADHFGLTTAEREWIMPGEEAQNRPYFRNRGVAWALSRLQKPFGCIERADPYRKRYRLTSDGQEAQRMRSFVPDAEERGVRTRLGAEHRLGGGNGASPKPPRRRMNVSRPLSAPYRLVSEAAHADRDPFEYDPDELDRQTRSHARLLNQVAELAKAAGCEVHLPGPGDPVEFDLAWTSTEGQVVVELKTLSATKGDAKQIRLGIGQVLDYQHRLHDAGAPVDAILVVDRKPRDSHWPDLCARHGIALVWPTTLKRLFV